MKNHNIWFAISLFPLVFIAPFGVINPMIAFMSCIVSGTLYMIWYFMEMKYENEDNEKFEEVE